MVSTKKICYWNQPVLSNEGEFLFKETIGDFLGLKFIPITSQIPNDEQNQAVTVEGFYLLVYSIPSFCLRDNSVHLHDCSPFWVGIFIIFNKENYYVLFLYRRVPSGKALKHFYML